MNTLTDGSALFPSMTFPVRIPDWAKREKLEIIKNRITRNFIDINYGFYISNINK
jgi:hypothetical protein